MIGEVHERRSDRAELRRAGELVQALSPRRVGDLVEVVVPQPSITTATVRERGAHTRKLVPDSPSSAPRCFTPERCRTHPYRCVRPLRSSLRLSQARVASASSSSGPSARWRPTQASSSRSVVPKMPGSSEATTTGTPS